MAGKPEPQHFGLPIRPFLYTLDQIAGLLSIEERTLKRSYVYFQGRSVGPRPREQMLARNVAMDEDNPDWRVAERELLRWMKVKGFKFYERGWALS